MAWEFDHRTPVFMQITAYLRNEIITGKYAPDEQIPPVRQLAFEASVNPNTMQKALQCLEDEGLLYTRGTVGRFVTSNTEVLRSAKETVQRETVRALLAEAQRVGISRSALIEYIQKEETCL